ncbi:MAG: helix-turn-helix domain-containing protein [Alkalimonas sp.]|nr:helix-turn-helix domain-containing protein [Alkalimonas sp.]
MPIVHQPTEPIRALNFEIDTHSRLWLAGGTAGLMIYDGTRSRPVRVEGTTRAYNLFAAGDWMYVAFHEGVYRLHTETLQHEKVLAGQFRELVVVGDLLLGIVTRSTQVAAYDLSRGQYLELVYDNPEYSFHANRLVKTPAGDVYFLSLPDGDLRSALLRFRPGEPIRVFKPDPLSNFVQHPDDLLFYTLAVHNDDIMVVNRHDKFLKFDTETEQFSVFAQLESSSHGIRNAIFVGDCLVGAGTNGLFFYCPDEQFSYTEAYSGFYSLPDRHQARLLFDPKQSMLWTLSFGSELSGFYLGDLPFLNAFKGGRNEVNDKQPFAVYFDSQGALWVGTNGFGVDKFPKQGEKQFFPLAAATDFAYHIISFYELANGQMLAGSIDGHVLMLDKGAHDFRLLLPDRLESSVSNFFQQGDFLYFTTLRTLYRLNLQTGSIDQFWSTSAYFGGAILLDLEVVDSQVVLATQAGLMLFDLDNNQTTMVRQLLPDGERCDRALHQLARQGNAIFFKGGGLCQLDATSKEVRLLNAEFPEVGNLHLSSNGVAWTFDGTLHAFSLQDNRYQRFHQYHGLLPKRPSQGFNTLHGNQNQVVLAHSAGMVFFDDELVNTAFSAVLPSVAILLNSVQLGGSQAAFIPAADAMLSLRQADRLVKANFDVVNYFQRDIRFVININNSSSPIELSSLSEVFLPLEQQGKNRLHISALDSFGNTLGVFELDYRVIPLWYKNIWFYIYFLAVAVVSALVAWRYREFILHNRQNLLKAQVVKQSTDYNREVTQSKAFLRNFIKLLRNDLDATDQDQPGQLTRANQPPPLSLLNKLKYKLNFARMLNDGVAGRSLEPEVLAIHQEARDNLEFLVVLYHDCLGKVSYLPRNDEAPLFVKMPHDLLAMTVTTLLVKGFLQPLKPAELIVRSEVADGALLISVDAQVVHNSSKSVNQQALRAMFPQQALQYYAELLLHSGIHIEASEGDVAVGYSARFDSVSFPVIQQRNDEVSAFPVNVEQKIQHSLLASATILVVEDNAFMLHLITDSLSRYSEVVSCMDAEAAMIKFEQLKPDIVLVDLHLPGMNGLDFCHWVRGQEGGAHLPVFIMSGDDDRQVLIRSAKANANDFIIKPIDFEVFFPKLCFHLSQYKTLGQGVVDVDGAKPRSAVASHSPAISDTIEYSKVTANSEFMAKLMDAVEEIIPQSDKTIDDLASLFHTSPRNFRRKVVSAVQMTPKELLKVRRLQHAADLLKTTDLSVTEISYRCGYASQSNFNRQFKTIFDCAPLDYRKRFQEQS